jgi:hypothetical protein
MEQCRSGRRPFTRLDVLHRENLDAVLRESGLDLAAARACGLKTAFVLRPREHGPHQASDLKPEGPWDVVAADFLDLARQLGC